MLRYLVKFIVIVIFLLVAYCLSGYFVMGEHNVLYLLVALLLAVGGVLLWIKSNKERKPASKFAQWFVRALLSISFSWIWVLGWGFGLGGMHTLPGQEPPVIVSGIVGIIMLGGLIFFIYVLPRLLYEKIVQGKE